MRYPGFSGHGVKCPILTTVVPRFSGDLIGCTIRGKWGPFGDLYLARKNLLCVWNKMFLGEIKFSQRRTRPVKFLWWCNASTWNIRNVWLARDDGHYYDVTSKCCGVTITTHWVEWTLSISEIRVFFCCFQELSGPKNTNGHPNKVWDKSKTTWAVGIAQLTHQSVRGGGKNPETVVS